MIRSPASALAAAVIVLGSIGLGACGSDTGEPQPPPDTALAQALASVGGGGAHGSVGVGWAEPDLVRGIGAGPELIDAALGPNADTVIEARARLVKRFGMDPLAASRLVSVGGSYAFGLRLEGVPGQDLERELAGLGGPSRQQGGDRLIDADSYASVPEPLLDLGINGLGARDSFGNGRVILAISDTARAALLGRGGRLLDEPIYVAAARCLGDVAVARLIPPKLLLSTELGFSQVAIGVGGDAETVCLLGGSPERAEEIAANLRRTLDPGETDPRTGARLGREIESAKVTTGSDDGIQVVRAQVQPVPGAEPGFFFRTVARGSLVQMLNDQ